MSERKSKSSTAGLSSMPPELHEKIMYALNIRNASRAQEVSKALRNAGNITLKEMGNAFNKDVSLEEKKSWVTLHVSTTEYLSAVGKDGDPVLAPSEFLEEKTNWNAILVKFLHEHDMTAFINQAWVVRMFRRLAEQLERLCRTHVTRVIFDLHEQVIRLYFEFCELMSQHKTLNECLAFQRLWPAICPWSPSALQAWAFKWQTHCEQKEISYVIEFTDDHPRDWSPEQTQQNIHAAFLEGLEEQRRNINDKILQFKTAFNPHVEDE